MGRVVLTEYYPRQQTLTAAGKQFADRLNEFFGGWIIDEHEVRYSSKQKQEEYVALSNGRQMDIVLTRSKESFEITATASYVFNEEYVSKITDQDKEYLSELVANTGGDISDLRGYDLSDYLCHLATTRYVQLFSVPGISEPLTEAEVKEEDHLSFLIPKLMIITGQAKEKNFHLVEAQNEAI